jgi:hypothetical protein
MSLSDIAAQFPFLRCHDLQTLMEKLYPIAHGMRIGVCLIEA